MNTDSEAVMRDIQERSIEARRNLAGMRENGGDSLPLIFPEGEDDATLIEKGFKGAVDIRLINGGKPKSLELAAMIEDAGFKRSRVLIDRDFDEIVCTDGGGESVVIQTNAHDVFMDVLCSAPRVTGDVVGAVNKIRDRRMQDREKSQHQALTISSALSLTFNLTCLRVLNARYGIGLKFDSFPFAAYLSSPMRSLETVVELVLHKSKGLDGVSVEIERGTVRVRNEEYRLEEETQQILAELRGKEWRTIGDHDFLEVLNFLLDDSWGTRKLRTLFEAEITRSEVRNCPWGTAISEFVEQCSCV